MAFRDLDEFLVVEPFVLPIRGRQYAFPGAGGISARTWLQMQSLSDQVMKAQRAQADGDGDALDAEALSDIDQAAIRKEIFGGLEDELAEAGLTGAHMDAIFGTLMAFHLSGREAAEAVWNAQGKAPAPNRAARRKKSSPGGSRASSSAALKSVATSPPGEPSSETGN
jgi:hypothetical protein